MMQGKALSDNLITQIRIFRSRGFSIRDIATLTGVAKSTVERHLKIDASGCKADQTTVKSGRR